jgi:hypothetical protein
MDFGFWHFVTIVALAATAVPVAVILDRAGLSKWWTIAFFLPLLNLVALWVFAFSHWPALDDRPK